MSKSTVLERFTYPTYVWTYLNLTGRRESFWRQDNYIPQVDGILQIQHPRKVSAGCTGMPKPSFVFPEIKGLV